MTQPTDTLTTLFRHNLWANLRLIEQCSQLTSAQLESAMLGTFGSIRDTLQHIATSERSYLSRISTGQPRPYAADAPPLTIAEIAEIAREAGMGLIEWAPKVQATDTVQVNWDGAPRDVPKTVLLTQAINHATEHRAQIMVMLTQLGVEPPELDSWTFFDEHDQ